MKLIWTRTAVEGHKRGGYDPRHTISNVTDSAVEPFVRQMRHGCPWLLVTDSGDVLTEGSGPQPHWRCNCWYCVERARAV